MNTVWRLHGEINQSEQGSLGAHRTCGESGRLQLAAGICRARPGKACTEIRRHRLQGRDFEEAERSRLHRMTMWTLAIAGALYGFAMFWIWRRTARGPALLTAVKRI